MKTLEENAVALSLGESVEREIRNEGISDSSVSCLQDEWQEVINKLIAWGRRPSFIDEDELESPSNESIISSFHLVRALRGEMLPVPGRVVGDGEGGIVFELFDDQRTETLEIDSEGLIEYMMFVDSRLVQRKQIFDG